MSRGGIRTSPVRCRGWIPALIFMLALALPRQCCPASAGAAGPPASTLSNLGAAVPATIPPLVLYGSETGTAEDVAWHIAGRMRARGLSPRCLAMDDFDIKELPRHRLVVCVAATAGDGAAPSNMRATWAALLRKDLPATALRGVDYAVFGLGDSGYAKFNAAARRLDVRLAQLGAYRLLPAGMGNDQDPQGEDTALSPWLQSLWETLPRRKHLPLKVKGVIDGEFQDHCSDLDFVDPAAAAAAASASTLVKVDGDYDGRLQGPPTMALWEAQEIVKSISSLSNIVLFSLGSPQAGGAASAESVSMAREIKAAGARLCFFDCLRSRRLAEALRVVGCQTPTVFVGGNSAAQQRNAAEWMSSGESGVVEGGGGVGGEPKCGGDVVGGMEGCLNDVWDGVGGAGHKWSSGALPCGSGTSKPGWSLAKVVSASRITADWIESEGKDVRHLELSTAGDECSYSPGDVALIMPRNRPSSVHDLLWTLELDGGAIVRSCDAPRELWGELPCTIEELVSANFDLDGPPRRRFLRSIASLAASEQHRERLLELCDEDGALEDYTKGGRATVGGVFTDFDSVRPGLSQLISIMPRLRPRPYSIASSPLKHPGQIHICCSLSRLGASPTGRLGVCSSFIKRASPGDLVPFKVTSGSLPLMKRASPGDLVPFKVTSGSLPFEKMSRRPAILVGPGTGIAPFRSYLWDMSKIRGRNEERGDVLFTGCRKELGDFLYASELGELEREGVVVVHTAFSRDSPQGKGKVYVQDLIRKHSEQVWGIMSQGGGVYVAGASGGMPKGVREAIEWVAATVGGVPDAKGYVDGMVRGGLYKEEVW